MSDPASSSSTRPSGDDAESVRRELDETRMLLVETEAEARALRNELTRLKGSAAGRVAVRLQGAARRTAPLGTRRQRALHHVAQASAALIEEGPRGLTSYATRRRHRIFGGDYADTPAGRQMQYREWRQRHQPDAHRIQEMADASASWERAPKFSVLMATHNPELTWLRDAIDSVQRQAYPNWQLCIADDASNNPEVRAMLDQARSSDRRIALVFRAEPGGIARAFNSALELAAGDFVAFLDHDDVLRPHALYAMAEHVRAHPGIELVYSDEEKILPSGVPGDPFFKPDHSPEMLLRWNYITHFVVISSALMGRLDGFRLGFDGSQDHDLLLRATELVPRVGHVADVLYSWRMVAGSAALSADYKPLAREAGRRAVSEALARRGRNARVEFGAGPGLYNVHDEIANRPVVDIVIPTRDRLRLLRRCVRSIEELSTYGAYRITIVDNRSRDPKTLEYLANVRHRVIAFDAPFNFSAIVNRAADASTGEHLLLLNNDCRVVSPSWIEAMLELSQLAEAGAVGARLLYPDGAVQHEGIALGRLHVAANMETRVPVVREVSAVTGACLMTRRSVFDELGGFDVTLAEAFNDVDYCLRVRATGRRVLITPHAELTHEEGATRGTRIPSHDELRFIERWGGPEAIEDPYVNDNVLWPNPLRLRMR